MPRPVTLWAFFFWAQSVAPPLPDLALDRFPPASRDSLRPVVERARQAPDDQEQIGRLAMALHAWEQWEAADMAYRRARHLARASFRWAYLDAVVLQRLGRADEALVALRNALGLRPDYLPARVRLAEALAATGKTDESERLYRDLLKEPAAEPVAEFELGRAAAAAGRHAEAVIHLERSVALFPELGAAHYALARSYRALGRTEAALRALDRHKQVGAGWPAIDDPILSELAGLRDDARTWLRRGSKLADAGDVAGAIAAHEEALRRDASLAGAHVGLISLYGRLQNWTKAEEHYRAAVALGAELEDAHYNYGVLLGLQGRWDESAEAYRSALAVNPLNPTARNNLGQILERRQKVEEAAAEYRRALEAAPAFRLARFNLGRMLIASGRLQEAIVELDKLREPRDAEAPRYLFALAVAHIRAGHRDAGMKWANEARTLALVHGQHDLAAAIERDLATLK
jgi:tetratricopeptide (TPR) repeat protein